jgi:hypothetical protein
MRGPLVVHGPRLAEHRIKQYQAGDSTLPTKQFSAKQVGLFIPSGFSGRNENVPILRYLRRSTSIAMPMPPATHIDSMPYVPSSVSWSLRSVVMIRAPVIPNG